MDLGRPLTVITPTVDADVLAVLTGADAPFTAPQVHRLAGRHSESGVRKVLDRLVGQGIVLRDRAGRAYLYRLNRDHLAAPHIEGIAGLRSEFFHRITELLSGWTVAAEHVAIFGSAVRGEMRPNSDIDLLVVRPGPVDPDDEVWQAQLGDLSTRVSAWTGNDARILEFSAEEVRDRLARSDRVILDLHDEGRTLVGPIGYLTRVSATAGK